MECCADMQYRSDELKRIFTLSILYDDAILLMIQCSSVKLHGYIATAHSPTASS